MSVVQAGDERGSARVSTVLRHRDLHDRLVLAACNAIEAEGLTGLRARTLAQAAGCSVGAIYGVFPDLDALILAVAGRTLDEIDAALSGAASGGPPAAHLVRLAEAYLAYATAHRGRWGALFQHRMPQGRPVSRWYAERQASVFAHIEVPLASLQPHLSPRARALLARTLFSAVHGVVALGLDEKVVTMTQAELRDQLRTVVKAMASGLAGPRVK